MRTVRFHDAARLELRHEVSYYTLISPVLGRRLAEAVEEAVGLAISFPEIGSPYLRAAVVAGKNALPGLSLPARLIPSAGAASCGLGVIGVGYAVPRLAVQVQPMDQSSSNARTRPHCQFQALARNAAEDE